MNHTITDRRACQAYPLPGETIRYYEREGLLPAPARSQGNYRQYDMMHVERLSFIRHCRSLDMTLAEIRALLDFRDAPTRDCAAVSALLDEHVRQCCQSILSSCVDCSGNCRQLRGLCAQPGQAERCGILNAMSRASKGVGAAGAAAHMYGTHRRGEAKRDRGAQK